RLLDRRHELTVALYFHRVADAELLLLDLEQLLARRGLKDERAPAPKRFAVDLERALAVLGLDPEVVTNREDLFVHLVARAAESVVPAQKSHARLLSS